MTRIDKYYKLCGLAFENSTRLHFDSAHMYESASYPTAYQLALLASEELGKTLMLQEFCWQYYANDWKDDPKFIDKYLKNIFTSHLSKQQFFAYMVNDFLNKNPGLKKQSSIITDLRSGLGEDAKQRSTFVGLVKRGRKTDLLAKTTSPLAFATPERAKRQITLNSDFLTIYTEGFLKGVFGVDVYDMAYRMNLELLEMLNTTWTDRGRDARRVMDVLKDKPYVEDPLDDWQ